MKQNVHLALCVFCISCIVSCFSLSNSSQRSRTIYNGLLASRGRSAVRLQRPVLVGFGGCFDGIVDAEPFLQALNAPEHVFAVHHAEIGSEEELSEVFAFFFSKGAAGERYVKNKQLFRRMVETAQQLDATSWTQGGNAALMAHRMAKDGLRDVMLAAPTGPAGVTVVPNNIATANEDVHIILEYKAGSSWGEHASPRANRLALHSDTSNAEITILPAVKQWLQEGSTAGMFVLGGFHLMQNYPFPASATAKHHHPAHNKLREVEQLIQEHLQNVPLHVEMASVSDANFMRSVEETLLRHATSIGSNEQELAALERFLSQGDLIYASDSSPRVADTLHRMTQVMNRLSSFKLRRMHVHTLAFQAVMSVVEQQECDVNAEGDSLMSGCTWEEPRIMLPGANETLAWLSPRASAARAALAAADWVCGDHEAAHEPGSYSFDVAETFVMLDDSFQDDTGPDARRIRIDDEAPVTCFTSHDRKYHVCVAPNLVCSRPKVTIGAGDNISGAGLMPVVEHQA